MFTEQEAKYEQEKKKTPISFEKSEKSKKSVASMIKSSKSEQCKELWYHICRSKIIAYLSYLLGSRYGTDISILTDFVYNTIK